MRKLIAGVSCTRVEDGSMVLVVFLALWRDLGLVKGKGAHHHSVLREALSHLMGWQPEKIRGNITRSGSLGGLDEWKDSF